MQPPFPYPPPPNMCFSAYDYNLYYSHQDDASLSLGPPYCSSIRIPVNSRPPEGGDLFSFLSARFFLQVQVDNICVQCFKEGGTCRTGSHGSFDCQHNDQLIQRQTRRRRVWRCLQRKATLWPSCSNQGLERIQR